MSVFIYEKDAFKKFIEVECGDDEQEKNSFISQHNNFGCCSFSAFLKEWQEFHERNREENPEYFDKYIMCLSVDGNGAIYGNGGYDRYAVSNTGEMLFIERLARNEEAKDRAKKAGFNFF
jgi:hypothetical protein